ncbi:putative signal transduction histidine kinase [Caenispirillum salinarum AK4]|uniref:histidine kinase n=1 Tax=Caenispirillum salinarum AK4 TaxID=1238182 RepID=K9H925_9PROT|nr:histidine kinase dimerization/phosphoacceptor domain -containing protein [Caenispirillum salinarum]EKV27088.1 putative signal transduction histidine kinase [Caenispirillum salinarum AK4]
MTKADLLIRRQKVLGDFGELALRCEDLDDVLLEACRLVGEALDTEFAKVMEIDQDGESLLVRAGFGWQTGVVNQLRLPMADKSSETYSAALGEPVIVQDIQAEQRFEFPQFLKDEGVRAMVNVPILLPGGRHYGLLQVDARSPREFGDEDIAFLRTYTAILGPVIDRLHKAHSLKLALEKNQRLLKELQHRVKNHLAIITGLVGMRARNAASDDARAELKAVEERIETLRLVHDQLHQAEMTESLSLRTYIVPLVENLCRAHDCAAADLEPMFEVEDIDITPEVAVPIGLVVNEFITNSIKHAFNQTPGRLGVKTVVADPGHVTLHLSDNGKGLPEGAQEGRGGSGSGMRLIDGLARQIGAEPHWSSSQDGTELRLEVNLGEKLPER